jgi:hypothetical protein
MLKKDLGCLSLDDFMGKNSFEALRKVLVQALMVWVLA